MRHLFVPACLCLMTLPGPLNKEPRLPLADSAAINIDKDLSVASVSAPETTKDLDSEDREAARIGENSRDTSPSEASSGNEGIVDDPAIATSTEGALPEVPPLPPIRKPVVERSREEICDSLTKEARANGVPAPFFIRLLFQESRFEPGVVSDAGAEGIAQFMPETSADVGLKNPYDPLQAIPAAARLLRDLAHDFGNLGLAAAAYNAGRKRVQDWLANKGKLPEETQSYVKTITGRAPGTFTAAANGSPAVKLPRQAPCQEAAGLLAWDGPEHIPLPPVRETKKDAARLANAVAESKHHDEKVVEKAGAKEPAHAAKMTARDAAEKKADGKKEEEETAKKPGHPTTAARKESVRTAAAEGKAPAEPMEAATTSQKKPEARNRKAAIAQVAAARLKHARKNEKMAQN